MGRTRRRDAFCVRVAGQSTSAPPFCRARGSINRVDVSRTRQHQKQRDDSSSSSAYIVRPTFLRVQMNEAGAAATAAAPPKCFVKRRGGKPGPTMSDVINRALARERAKPRHQQTAQQHTHSPIVLLYKYIYRFRWRPSRKLFQWGNRFLTINIKEKEEEKPEEVERDEFPMTAAKNQGGADQTAAQRLQSLE